MGQFGKDPEILSLLAHLYQNLTAQPDCGHRATAVSSAKLHQGQAAGGHRLNHSGLGVFIEPGQDDLFTLGIENQHRPEFRLARLKLHAFGQPERADMFSQGLVELKLLALKLVACTRLPYDQIVANDFLRANLAGL